MQTAFNQMMMTSGQWQNQMGMQGNERTGAAINARQQQGYTSVYHFQDNYAMALRLTGKMLIDLMPHVLDTKRLLQLRDMEGNDFELEIDPGAKQAYAEQMNEEQEIIRRVFNPQLGTYGIEADVGPAYGTRREQTAEVLKLLLTQAPALTPIIGDLLLRSLDIAESEEAAQRLKRMIPAQALGKGPTKAEQALQSKVVSMQGTLSEALQKLGKQELKIVGKEEMRDIDVYEAETKRLAALSKQLPLDQDGMRQLIHGLVQESLQTHLTPVIQANADELTAEGAGPSQPDVPPLPGAKKAPDGQYYIRDPSRPGKYLRVRALEGAA